MIEISLRSARVNAGFTIKEVAKLVGLHHETLSKYENDSSDIPISLLNELSEMYQMPMDNIFLGKRYDLIRSIREKSIHNHSKQPA